MTMNKLRFVEETQAKTPSEQKKELRVYMKARRGVNENRDIKEKLLIDNLLQVLFDETKGACTQRNVFVYLSYSSEAPTDALIERLLEIGCNVYCPKIEKGEMYAVAYGEDFTLSPYGIREPVGEAQKAQMDVAIIPFLAVDKQGNRLGYGGGYYDRFLKKNPAIKRIAYGYDFQIVNKVPVNEDDEKMEVVVTDRQIIYC